MDLLRLRVKAIQPESTGTKTIFLERMDGQDLVYKAGQFLTILFSFYHRQLRRSYSLSTAPGIDPVPAITVKRVQNGEISRFILDHLHVGDELTCLPPSGRFTLDSISALLPSTAEPAARKLPEPASPPLLFIAAGSGMVPIFSLLKAALSTLSEVPLLLISQQHDEAASPFRAQLARIQERHSSRFQWIELLSTRDGHLNNWRLEELLVAVLPELPTLPNVFLCGPSGFMRMAQFTLHLLGFPGETIKKENFTVEFVPSPPIDIDPTPKLITIHTGKKRWQFETVWPQTILQAGLAHQVQLPYSCRGGRCSTCVARCLHGIVKMTINEVLTEKDLREGLVLTCVGYAETDVHLTYEI
jgi:ring-1,2-phenylacetyl-CoA epoxidase subunit PaaE